MNRLQALWRIALRDAWRAKGRTALVVLLIGLPIAAAVAGDTLLATRDLRSAEAPSRFMGSAQALLHAGNEVANQAPDPRDGSVLTVNRGRPADLSDARDVLGDRPAVMVVDAIEWVTQAGETGRRSVIYTQPGDPLVKGMFRLVSGRLPRSADEAALPSSGWDATSESTIVVGDRELRVTGTIEWLSPELGGLLAVSETPTSSTSAEEADTAAARETDYRWLVGGDPVTWSQVQALNKLGFTVTSRAVVLDPPPREEWGEVANFGLDFDRAYLAQIALIVIALAVVEIALLAGPAIAVSARRNRRTIALLVSSGGEPADARGLILALAGVLGLLAAALGVLAGLLGAWLGQPLMQRATWRPLGPFDVNWWHLLGYAAIGVASALVAGLVPAWLAAKVDPARGLTGRVEVAAERPTSRWARLWNAPVWWGLVALGVAVAVTVKGTATANRESQLAVAASLVPLVVGMVLLIGPLLRLMEPLVERAPMLLRYAGRDATRHLSRTVPAVAAIAATVIGVLTLAVANASSEATEAANYTPETQPGTATLALNEASPADWAAAGVVIREVLPEAEVEARLGPLQGPPDYTDTLLEVEGGGTDLSGWGSTPFWVAKDGLPGGIPGLTSAQRRLADQALKQGRAVAFGDREASADVVILRQSYGGSEPTDQTLTTVPGLLLQVDPRARVGSGIVPLEAMKQAGIEVQQVDWWVHGSEIDRSTEREISAGLAAAHLDGWLFVERGYRESTLPWISYVIAGLAALVMLVGAITATALALSDARDDLATLGAVGASPGSRRLVAGAFALLVTVLGLGVGLVFGALPAVATTHLMIDRSYLPGADAPEIYDVPWRQLSLLLLLPVVAAAVAMLGTRPRTELATPEW
ncbi:MAG: FtsX-like permease family protein [Nocardioides sp.]